MDFWECVYKKEKMIVLTMIDHCTKWAECAVLNSHAAAEVSSKFLTVWVCRFGVPKRIITDNAKAFSSTVFETVCLRLGVQTLKSAVFHPEGNAPIESFHRRLNRGLLYFSQLQLDATPFEEALQLVLFSYRSTQHSTTLETPGYALYGADLSQPFDNDWRFCRSIAEKDRIKALNIQRLELQWRAQLLAQRRTTALNTNRQEQLFEVGQLVLCRVTPSEQCKAAYYHHESKHKLLPKWSLPCRVVHVFPGGTKAVVRNLVVGTIKQIHIQDARFIQPPKGVFQEAEWAEALQKEMEVPDPRHPQVISQILDEWMTPMEQPQLGLPPKKRQR
jgi:hypothetical protein